MLVLVGAVEALSCRYLCVAWQQIGMLVSPQGFSIAFWGDECALRMGFEQHTAAKRPVRGGLTRHFAASGGLWRSSAMAGIIEAL